MASPSIKKYFLPQRKNFIPIATSPLHDVVNRDVEKEVAITLPSTPQSHSRKSKRYGDNSGDSEQKLLDMQ